MRCAGAVRGNARSVTNSKAQRSSLPSSELAGKVPGSPGAHIMNLYSTIVFLHVITAILGLGPLTVLAIGSARPTVPLPWDRIARTLRLVGWSLAAMFATGAWLIGLSHGALGETGWVRASVGLFLLLGALHGMARRQLRKLRSAPSPTPSTTALAVLLLSMCAAIAAITYLMEAKPW